MECQKSELLHRRSSDSNVLDLLMRKKTFGTELRRTASENCYISSKSGCTIELEETNNGDMLCNSLSSLGTASDILISDHYEKEAIDFERNIEHYVIVAKYGLAGKTKCTCNSEKSIPSSSSCSALQKSPRRVFDTTRQIKSCFDLRKYSEDIDHICMKHFNDVRALKPYNEACQVYEMFVREPKINEDFSQAEYLFQLNYPHYWEHIRETYHIYPISDMVSKERETKLHIIQSCICLLKEEEIHRAHYIEKIHLFESRVNFSGRNKDMQEDFEMACNYMKKEYPFLFTILMKKYKLSKFVTDRMVIEDNRRAVAELSGLPHEILSERDDQFMLETDWWDNPRDEIELDDVEN